MSDRELQDKTIKDFGVQWNEFPDVEGWVRDAELFSSIAPPFVTRAEIAGKRVADIGSGSGAIVIQLLSAGPERIYAVEPSTAMEVLKRNTACHAAKIEYLNVQGEGLPAGLELDYVFSIGVIHHIPEPAPTVRAALAALRPGGALLIWLYGKEGNQLYLFLARLLRRISVRLPHRALLFLSRILSPFLDLYIVLCRVLPLPMRDYMVNVLGKLSARQRRTTIYDQLHPHYARYYSRAEAQALLVDNGFVDVRVRNREGYSWTVFGRRPEP